ncbi:flagellar basal body P-ring formation chaperone FlgA [Vibrio ziniensis]|uniref:Flagella basal body P-ring formation protein FlgA n=1 Tax=Vibrio ziniensis TaxID=2711221 RepID=A0A6G7CQY1_9VIBR|nr:flagellar basal body P-ring formation chaperone FlgA [Vibrio ziniensis]QIH44512.1 flagellar basal body P-ring formation protein FlgA [Vibrio ziniensis]
MIMMFVLLLLSTETQAANMTEQKIQQLVESQLKQEIVGLAEQRKWAEYQTDWQVWVPSSANHLKECHSPLIISGQDNQSIPVGNLKRSLTCDDGSISWSINVTVKASLTLPVVVLQTPLSRGQTIDASMLKIETRTLTHQDDFFTRISDATGKDATRRMRVGQILDPMLLNSPPLVMKGNQVIIVASKNGVNASTQGVALQDGGLGDQIEVRNSSSQTVIHAVVTGLNQVNTQF